MTIDNRIAKCIRAITVPPVLVTILILILSLGKRDLFTNNIQIMSSIAMLGFFPLLAYPLQHLLPNYKNRGREGQRKLAFILNIIGYITAVIWGYISKANTSLQFIYNTYFISALFLTLCNKVFHVKGSGHACSATGPIIFLVYFIGWKVIFPCIIVASLIVWSSLKLKRHTVMELIVGCGTCVLAFLCAYIIFIF